MDLRFHNVADRVIVPGIVAHRADVHIAQRILAGRIVAERTVAPGEPVPIVTGKKGGTEVFQEFRIAAAAGAGQVGLVLDGVAFEQHFGGIESHADSAALLAREDVEDGIDALGIVCHLPDVASLVNGQLGDPVAGIERIGHRRGIEFQPPRRPDHHAVAVHLVGVQDDGHMRRVDVQAGQVGVAGLFEAEEIFPGQGIDLRRVDDVEMISLDPAPAGVRGRRSVEHVLGGRGQGAPQQQTDEEDVFRPHKAAKIHKIRSLAAKKPYLCGESHESEPDPDR